MRCWGLSARVTAQKLMWLPALLVLTGQAFAGLGGSIFGIVRECHSRLPMSDVRITVRIWSGPVHLKSLPNGQFSVFVPEGSDYVVEARKKGYRTGIVRGVKVLANDFTKVEIDLAPISWPWPKELVSLRAANGKYVCADLGRAGSVVADRERVGPWETFVLFRLDESRVALQASNGKFICADLGSGASLKANRECPGKWEKFVLVAMGGDRVALRATNGKYVCADLNRDGMLVADRERSGPWETFILKEGDLGTVLDFVTLRRFGDGA